MAVGKSLNEDTCLSLPTNCKFISPFAYCPIACDRILPTAYSLHSPLISTAQPSGWHIIST